MTPTKYNRCFFLYRKDEKQKDIRRNKTKTKKGKKKENQIVSFYVDYNI